jgi:hypothetical protein
VEKVTEQTTLMQQTQKHELITSVHAWTLAKKEGRPGATQLTHDDARDAYPGRILGAPGPSLNNTTAVNPANIHYVTSTARMLRPSGVSTRLERRQRGSAPAQRPAIIPNLWRRHTRRETLPTTDRPRRGHLFLATSSPAIPALHINK